MKVESLNGILRGVADEFSPTTLRALARVEPQGTVSLNDIARARLSLYAPLFVDSYDAARATGSFILIEEATNHTVAAGLVQ